MTSEGDLMSAKEAEAVKYARGQNPNSRSNLKPFRPGESGCPGGRARSASKLFREIGAEVVGDGEGAQTRLRRVIEKLYELAENGDRQAAQLIVERLEGRPHQSISLDADEHSRLERKLQNYLAESEREGDPMTREQAIAVLAEEDARFEGFE
jgi:hypothetical protein